MPLSALLLRLPETGARRLHAHLVDGELRFDEVQARGQPAEPV